MNSLDIIALLKQDKVVQSCTIWEPFAIQAPNKKKVATVPHPKDLPIEVRKNIFKQAGLKEQAKGKPAAIFLINNYGISHPISPNYIN